MTEDGFHDDEEGDQRERYGELLAELRTIIPGVQVLFAFLLTVPFSSRFAALDDLGVQVFTIALVGVGLATVVLLTPAAYHRLTPTHDRRRRIKLGVRVTIVGMVLLAASITAALFVVARLIFTTQSAPPVDTVGSTVIGLVIAGIVGVAAVALWFLLPFLRRDISPTVGERHTDREER